MRSGFAQAPAPRPSPSGRGRWLVLLALVGLGGLAVWWWGARPPEEDAELRAGAETPRWRGPADALATAPSGSSGEEGAPASPGAGLTLRATLLPAADGQPFRGVALVGPAYVSDEDRREGEAAQREGRGGPGPERPEALANVRTWLSAPVTPAAAGGGQLGPVEVPPAPVYRLLAWEADGTCYETDFLPGAVPPGGVLDAGALSPTAPTGLRVRLARGLPAGARVLVRLERGVSPDPAEAVRASRLLPLLARVRPDVAAAFEEEGLLPLSLEGETVLAPLPPDPTVRLRLFSASGQEGTPLEVPLREGRVEPVELDWARLLPAEAHRTVELRGRLVLEGTGRAPPGAVLTPLEPAGAAAVQVEADGRFRVAMLPASRPSRLAATFAPPASGRPLTPARVELEAVPDGGEGPLEVTWQVPRLRWLVLRLDPHARAQLGAEARAPYPVFLLQRADAAGGWTPQGADFLPEGDDMAVSLAAPGRYRVLAAASPALVFESEAVDVGAQDGERGVRLRLPPGAASCEVLAVWAGSGRPVPGAHVLVAGASGSLPPLEGLTDAEGRFRLGRVHTGALRVEVEAGGAAPVEREALSACTTSGQVRVEL